MVSGVEEVGRCWNREDDETSSADIMRNSAVRELWRHVSAALLDVYRDSPAQPREPSTLEIVTIVPPWRRLSMSGRNA